MNFENRSNRDIQGTGVLQWVASHQSSFRLPCGPTIQHLML